MRTRFLLGAGVALAMALSSADASAQLLPWNQPGVAGAWYFGGERLSGTGPKAGGPRYLHRFAIERTVSVDTTAAGGNASLLSLEEAPA